MQRFPLRRGTCALSTSSTVPTAAAAVAVTTLVVPLRSFSLYNKVHSITQTRLANQYNKSYTSKDIPHGPRAGSGFDPVYTNHVMEKITGPLQRRTSTTHEDFMTPEESEQWMTAKHAAKILEMKEEELSGLTREVLEDRWLKRYRETKNAEREEVLIAAEVLLEYLDSSVMKKKSRQHYRNFLQTARLAVDIEMKKQKSEKYVMLMYLTALSFTMGCGVIIAVMYLRQYISKKDAEMIGNRVSDYVNMTFMQPKNVEPAPDYATRYYYTPTMFETDQKNSTASDNNYFSQSDAVRISKEREAYNKQEEAEMLKMLNDANEAEARERRLSASERSRVAVHRPEDYDEKGNLIPPSSDAADGNATPRKSFSDLSFREFSSLMANNFGGGSRFQRLTRETSERAATLQEVQQRSAPSVALPSIVEEAVSSESPSS